MVLLTATFGTCHNISFKQISRFQQEDDKQVEKHYLHYLAGTVILSSTVHTMSTSVEGYLCIDVFKQRLRNMKILVLSDIHSNHAALQSVFDDSEGEWEMIWCLGDLVGYGPDPDECIDAIREHDHIALSGNHDWAVLDRLDIRSFNNDAQAAIRWTQRSLSSINMAYLASLPSTTVESSFTLAHASPRQPVWEYILDTRTAASNFSEFNTSYCFVGHTHVPMVFEQDEERNVDWFGPLYGHKIELASTRLIINPGSVGQPRDYDPRSAYGLLDLHDLTWEFRRIPYDVELTQERMTENGLPSRLISRLGQGA